jgi:hypothetical protein
MRSVSDPYAYFIKAFQTELEHGRVNPQTNVTSDDKNKTAKIVAAHLLGVESDENPSAWRPFPAYYDFLWDLEKNGRKK